MTERLSREEFGAFGQAATADTGLGSPSVEEAARVEERSRRLAAIVESSADAIVGKDLQGRINEWNHSAERLFGYTREEVLGQSIEILMPPDRADDWRHILRRVASGERLEHFETRRRTRDGRILDVSLTVSPVRDRNGRIVGAAKIVRDMTALKEAEREAARMRELFVGTISHDLRNPLNVIAVSVHTLRRHASEADQRVLARIANSAERMSRMLDQLLDFTASRIGGGIPIQVRQADLSAVCRKVVDEFEVLHPGRVLVSEEGDLVGRWDGDRLERALGNLVSNGLKYGSPQEPVRITARGRPQGVLVEVTNQGPPIPEPVARRIFDPFQRGPVEEKRGIRGLGLGLFIAREIVRAHHGEIAMRSNAAGTTFSVSLPRTSA
jgi:PAS domain S-box-containing protein